MCQEIEYDPVELLRLLHIHHVGSAWDDDRLRLGNLGCQPLDLSLLGGQVVVADHEQRRHANIRQTRAGRWFRGNHLRCIRDRNGESMILHVVDTLANSRVNLVRCTPWPNYPGAYIQLGRGYQITLFKQRFLFPGELLYLRRWLLTAYARSDQHQ